MKSHLSSIGQYHFWLKGRGDYAIEQTQIDVAHRRAMQVNLVRKWVA